MPKAPAVRGGASAGVRKVAPAKGTARAGCGVVSFENGAPVGGSGKGAPGPAPGPGTVIFGAEVWVSLQWYINMSFLKTSQKCIDT